VLQFLHQSAVFLHRTDPAKTRYRTLREKISTGKRSRIKADHCLHTRLRTTPSSYSYFFIFVTEYSMWPYFCQGRVPRAGRFEHPDWRVHHDRCNSNR